MYPHTVRLIAPQQLHGPESLDLSGWTTTFCMPDGRSERVAIASTPERLDNRCMIASHRSSAVARHSERPAPSFIVFALGASLAACSGGTAQDAGRDGIVDEIARVDVPHMDVTPIDENSDAGPAD